MDEDQSVPSFHGLSKVEMGATEAYKRLRISDVKISDDHVIANFVSCV